MSAQGSVEVSIDAAQALAKKLSERPDLVRSDPQQLADEFRLPTEFVEQVIGQVSVQKRRQEPDEERNGSRPVADFFLAARLFFRKLTADPLRFITITAIIAVVGHAVLNYFLGSTFADRSNGNLNIRGGLLFVGFAIPTFCLHMLCYLRHGMARYALLGGVVCWMISSVVTMISNFFTLPASQSKPAAMLIIALVMFFLCVLYASCGIAFSVLGGAWRVSREEKEQANLTRQELLARLFHLQEELQKATDEQVAVRPWSYDRWAGVFRAHWVLWSIGLGAFSGLVQVLLQSALTGGLPEQTTRQSPLAMMAGFALFIFWIVTTAIPGFLSARYWKALIATALLLIFNTAMSLIPVEGYGYEKLYEQMQVPVFYLAVALEFLVGTIAYGGSKIESRASLERRFNRRDPATLTAEIIRIQSVLAPKTTTVCVMFVDVAKSSEMKATADPLVVEWTFREYQAFVQKVCERYGGQVQYTAGDGSVVSFPDTRSAYRAGQTLQSEIATFNNTKSRLKQPFRIRVGIHSGEVVASLEDVEFTNVIDVAAHVQNTSPVGGIAVTEPVAAQLGEDGLIPLKGLVDGYQTYIALDPTGQG